MTTPEIAQCPDGFLRRLIYRLGPYLADYPEQTLATGMVQGWCPKCLKARTSLGDSKDDLCQCQQHTKELMSRLDAKVLWDDYEIIAEVIVS